MNTRSWIYSIITYIVLTVGLILVFDHYWPDNHVLKTIVTLVVSGLITHLIRKLFDFISDMFSSKTGKPSIGILVKVDHASRNFVSYGASCGKVVQAGNFKANYEVEVELIITIQNETPSTAYGVELNFTPNEYAKKYTLIDERLNKLEPLEGNKHIEYRLRINRVYNDVYAREVDNEIKEICQIGKGRSLLNGSGLVVKYKDSRQKPYTKTETLN